MRRKTRLSEHRNILATFIEHRGALAAFLLRRSVHADDVEDALHEVFLSAYRAQKNQEIMSAKAYLFVVARNFVSKRLALQSRSVLKEIDDAIISNVESPDVAVDEQVYQNMRFGVFTDALEALPPQCRKVFVLRKFSGMSHKEIAKRLDISTSTVERHITNALSKIRVFMN